MQREAKLEWIGWVAESTHNTSVESFVVLVANGALRYKRFEVENIVSTQQPALEALD
jgi:hypothetical protein